MRKFILLLAAVMMAVSLSATGAAPVQADNNNTQDTTVVAKDAARTRAGVVADSIALKGQRVGRKVADGAVVVFDSVSSKGERFGKKAKVWGDSLSKRSRRAWKAFNAGNESQDTETTK